MYRVQRSTLADVIRNYPHVQTVCDGFVLTDTADKCCVFACRDSRQRIHVFFRIVIKLHSGGCRQDCAGFFCGDFLFRFYVDGFAVAVKYRNTNARRRDFDIGVFKNLIGFVDHFHFFFGIVVVEENVDMRQAVESNAVRVNGVFRFYAVEELADLGFKFLYAFLPGAAYCLVGGNNDALDRAHIVDRFEGDKHLNGGAVGVRNNAVVFFKGMGVDFRNDKRTAFVHAPSAGIVNNNAAGFHGVGRKLRACAASC